jgi:uncharacterized RDD family membrane protein YckC
MNTAIRKWMLSAVTMFAMTLQAPAFADIHAEVSSDNAVVRIGADAYLGPNDKAETVVAVGGSSTSEGEVSEAVVAVMGDVRVTGPVAGDVNAVMGSVYVNSKIGGGVVAVLGDVELGPNAEVTGDVVTVGGRLIRDPAAIIHGSTQQVSFPVEVGQLSWLRPWVRHALLYARPLAIDPELGWAWALALGFLALYVFMALLLPEPMQRCVRTLETRPGATFLASFLSVLLTPLLILLLLVTVIGIAVVPFLLLALFFIGLLGKAVILAALGRRILGRSSGTAMPPVMLALAVLIGGAIVLALYLVPFVGLLTFNLIAVLGFGAVVYTIMQGSRAQSAAPSGPAAPNVATGPARPTSSTAPHSPAAAANMRPPYGSASDAEAPASPGIIAASRVEPHISSSDVASENAATAGAADLDATSASAAHANSDDASTADPSHAGEFATGTERPTMSDSATTSSNTPPPSTSGPIPPSTAASLPRATFPVRMAALLIDIVLIAVITNMVFTHTRVFATFLLPLAIYGAVMWKLRGSTIGGIVCHLQVARLDGREIDWATAIVRALGCLLSLVAAGLGFFWVLFDPERQAWHDKIAGTVVVRVPKGISLV